MLASLQDKLVGLLLPIVLGPIVASLTQWSKKAWGWLDKQHAIVKQVWAALWTLALTALVAFAGRTFCADGSAMCEITGLDYRALLTWAFALAAHGWKRKEK